MKLVNITLASVFCSLFFLALTGCSKNDAPKTAPSPSTSKRAALPEEKPPFTREKLKNLADYRTIDASSMSFNEAEAKVYGKTLLTAYWSASKESPEWAASDLFDDVFAEADTFRRQDLAKTHKTDAEAFIAESRKFSPLAFRLSAQDAIVRIERYDEKEKGFQVYLGDAFGFNFSLKRTKGNMTLYPSFLNMKSTKGFAFYKPKDEAEARKIEAALSSSRSGDRTAVPVIAYSRVVGTYRNDSADSRGDSRSQQLFFYIAVDGIAVQAPKTGETLFTLGIDQLDAPIWADKETLRRINGS